MKLNVKEILAAATVFMCSFVFCFSVLHGNNLSGEYEEAWAVKENSKRQPVIIIDPGHGGMDGGASADDGTMEKDINLEIAMKLKEIAGEYPVKVVMTRETDISLHSDESASIKSQKRQDLLKRKEIIDNAQGDLAVSIHLNSFKEDSSVYGAQVFYPKEDVKRTDGRTCEHNSKSFAENIQKSLEMNISDGRERSIMTKGDFLVFNDPSCPMVLVECGFLSNKEESEKLKSTEYQEKLATAVWEGINENLGLEKEEKKEIIVSTNKAQKK